jgi:hypothetical protein
MHILRLARISVALVVVLGSSPALAENWVTLDSDPHGASVDKDSIRRGDDGLVYFTANSGAGKGDHAADCQQRITYTIKLYVMNGIDYPNWRADGSAVVPDSIGDRQLQYACANA